MSKSGPNKKSVEDTYQKLTPIEHVLKRPDTYVGSIEKQPETQWVLNQDESLFVQKSVTYSPALYKVYDQIVVNAADNYQRDTSMDYLNIEINESQGYVKVHNNGRGIPVVTHAIEKMYVPQMIFGHLLTGSNYDDNEKRLGGGRNGYGAKLANIFSTKFVVECGDSENKKHFHMVWTDNMGKKTMPTISSYNKKNFVEIVFYPDFKRFNMTGFDQDIVKLFRKRVYDLAGVLSKVKVCLNGKEIKMKSFNDYVDMYLGKPSEDNHPIKILDKDSNNKTWQVVISRSDGELKQVSFVNAISTYKGGSHVNSVLDQVLPKVVEKLKNPGIKPHQIKSKLFVFINCLIENPTFDSQLKQTLTTKPSSFGSKWEISEKMLKSILSTGIVEELTHEAQARQMTKMAKVTANGKKARIDVPKLEDANDAGTKRSEECILILTEGDSAKALAMAGISIVGRDRFGVFPLRGKLLNVRQKDKKAVLQNVQLINIVKILGLQYNKQYTDLKSLRYGSIMIMTDQDADGSHIKGLIINFIHYYWPSLFRYQGFLRQFITPLLKATKGNDVRSFFTTQEFKIWADTITNLKTWRVKYYKGLGTSTNKEGQEYFKNIQAHEKFFTYQDQRDDIRIDLVFSKKKADERKEWLSHYNPDDIIEFTQSIKSLSYHDFVDKQLIHFSNSNNKRAIPSIMDGLKPGQRKVLYACFKRNLKEEIKVAQLGGYVSEHSAYHHGQSSLTDTIILLAQNFVGSNNINLLMPNGQFGSRSQGGDDHASARYIFTCLSKITRILYPEADDHTLKYLQDDGQLVEPEFYCPIIPMVLVNGCEGMGTGWSTKIPNHNPRELCQQIRRRIRGLEVESILPWYKNFQGDIVQNPGGVTTRGIIRQGEGNSIHVTQLPIGKWTIPFKQMLNVMVREQNHVVGFKEHHTQDRVHFQIEFEQGFLDRNTRYPEDGPPERNLDHVYSFLKLSSKKCLTNMVTFDPNNNIVRYATAKSIFEQYFKVRLEFYGKRKVYLLSRIQRQVEIITMKCRFITQVVTGELEVRNTKRKQLVQELVKRGFTKFSEFTRVRTTKLQPLQKKPKMEDEEESSKEVEQVLQGVTSSAEFDYLLKLAIWNLTFEKVQTMKRELDVKEGQLKQIESTEETTMWLNDLTEFIKVLDEVEEHEENERQKALKASKGAQQKGKKKPGKKIAKKAQSDSDTEQIKPKRKAKQSSAESVKSKGSKESGQKRGSSKSSVNSDNKSNATKDSVLKASSKQNPGKVTTQDLFSKYGVGDSKKPPLFSNKDSKKMVEQQPQQDSNSGANMIKKSKRTFDMADD